jgi:hypothetical protein
VDETYKKNLNPYSPDTRKLFLDDAFYNYKFEKRKDYSKTNIEQTPNVTKGKCIDKALFDNIKNTYVIF